MSLLLAVAAVLGQPNALVSQPPPAAAPAEQPIDPERLEAARALITAFDMQNHVRQQSELLASLVSSAAIAAAEVETGETMPSAVAERVQAAARNDSDAMYRLVVPGAERAIIEAYARHFTVPELERLTILITDPLVRRMERLNPDIVRRALENSLAEITATASQGDEMQRVVSEWLDDINGPAAPSS